jgi:hypothetical protein
LKYDPAKHDGAFRSAIMVAIRTGLSLAEAKSLTLGEARIALEEASKVEEQELLRLIEAFHSPNRAIERMQKREHKGALGKDWKALAYRIDPKRVAEAEKSLQIAEAAREFLKKVKRGG